MAGVEKVLNYRQDNGLNCKYSQVSMDFLRFFAKVNSIKKYVDGFKKFKYFHSTHNYEMSIICKALRDTNMY